MVRDFMRHQETFSRVLVNLDDQVTVRELLKKLVPPEIQEEIVREYNASVDAYNYRIANQKLDLD